MKETLTGEFLAKMTEKHLELSGSFYKLLIAPDTYAEEQWIALGWFRRLSTSWPEFKAKKIAEYREKNPLPRISVKSMFAPYQGLQQRTPSTNHE